MLWDIRARMKPALSVIDMIPDVHRTPALAVLRKAALEGRTTTVQLTDEDRELAFYDGPVQLISPIGGRLLRALYREGRLKLKKRPQAKLPKLDAYIETEPAFRREVAALMAAEETKRQRLAEIVQDPACARPEELSPYLIDKVVTAHLGYGAYGSLVIAGLTCHKSLAAAPAPTPEAATAQVRAEDRVLCWWLDAQGNRQGDAE
ncbi:hypothetical protein [Phaeovulum sp. W22_SRMD_FR3]|uniref:hypothetical protein n=1 Tax=Phaeovulum sp. W22_SRMD_FR3 TaxID=3240274 RepID=UPI003F9A7572